MLSDLSLVRGWPATVAALRSWNAGRWRVLLPWIAVSFAVACLLLGLTLVIANATTPDLTPPDQMPANIAEDPSGFFRHVLLGNLLVLALHAMACFAGYITHVAMPTSEGEVRASLRGLTRFVARMGMVYVPFATIFSICTQAWVQGERTATLAYHLKVPRAALLATVLPHALLELTAVFLPLGAWLVASRRRDWNELIAATLVTIAIAVPAIAVADVIETNRWPGAVARLQQSHPVYEGQGIGRIDAPLPQGAIFPATTYLELHASLLPGRRFPTMDAAIAALAPATPSGGVGAVVSGPKGYEGFTVWGWTTAAWLEGAAPAASSRGAQRSQPVGIRALHGGAAFVHYDLRGGQVLEFFDRSGARVPMSDLDRLPQEESRF